MNSDPDRGPALAPPDDRTLTGRTVRGTLVQTGLSLVLNVLALIQGVLFARWFAPAQLGLLDTTNLVVRTTLLFSQLGTRQALIRERARYRQVLASALSFDALVSTASFLALLLGAPWFARLFQNPELTLWIRLLAVTSYATTLALPGAAWDQAMRFGVSKIPRAAGTLTTIGLTGALALAGGAGAEALLWGALAGFAVEHALIWLLAPHRPRPAWDPADVRAVAGFTAPLLLSALLNYIVFEGDDLMLRYFRDDAALAIYRRSFEWPFYLTTLVAMTSGVLYPALVHLTQQPDRLRRAFRRANRYIALVTVPAGIALAWFAGPLVIVLYGPRWVDCVPLLRIFALAFMLRVSTGYNWHLLPLSRGDTRAIVRVGAGSALLTVALGLPLIFHLGGAGGALTNVLVALIWALPARLWAIRRELSARSLLGDLARPLAAAVLALAPIALLATPTSFLALAGQILLYGTLYGVTLLALVPGLGGELRALVAILRHGR